MGIKSFITLGPECILLWDSTGLTLSLSRKYLTQVKWLVVTDALACDHEVRIMTAKSFIVQALKQKMRIILTAFAHQVEANLHFWPERILL
jgi:hypothetical protein